MTDVRVYLISGTNFGGQYVCPQVFVGRPWWVRMVRKVRP